jgi:quercetin dioxygenase-like cupin family protein
MIIRHYEDVEALTPQEPGIVGVKMRVVIGEEEGAPNFIMRHFSVEPGGQSPYHSHPWEHEVFVLKGEGEVIQGDKAFRISPGNVIYIPSGEEHQFVNKGNELMEFLCLIPRV